ncbi:MAG: hypothetical protein LBJ00_05415 [Planctomycetaceae bacterium]|nr:hypothetical protein [Planctomycetaceae bacterium]
MKLNTQAQQREAVAQGRSLSPHRLRYNEANVRHCPKISFTKAQKWQESRGNFQKLDTYYGWFPLTLGH